MKGKVYIIASIIFGVVLLISIIVFAVSVSTVELNHIAIVQNKFNKSINEDNVYLSGRYIIGATSR
jgi:cell division protein FtsI/penicillin-binding protein 2